MILVTGAAGFIGSHLVKALVARGEKVIAVERQAPDSWRRSFPPGVMRCLSADDYLKANLSDITAVYHMGAISSTTETDVELLRKYNTQATTDLFTWCALQKVPLVYASSAATYGDGSSGYFSDEAPLEKLHPLNAYAASKHRADVINFADVVEPPRWYGLKFFNVYGTGEEHKGAQRSVLSQMCAAAAAGLPMRLFRYGQQRRDWVAVEDCVATMLYLMGSGVASGIYNVGTGRAPTFCDLADVLAEEAGARTHFIEMPAYLEGKYQALTRADVRKLRSTGFTREFIRAEDGAKALLRSMQETPAQ